MIIPRPAYNDGHTWGFDAFNGIQDGIDIVKANATVHVAAGTYLENITLKNGTKLIGEDADNTIIDGNQEGAVVTVENCGLTTTINGFTLTNGIASKGGGLHSYKNSDLAILNCIFKDNQSPYSGGGGIYNEETNLNILNSKFIDNDAQYCGGIYNINNSSIVIINSIFAGNAAVGSSGAVFNNSSSAIISGCIFTGNSGNMGGAIRNYVGRLELINSTVYGNQADQGYAIYHERDSYTMIENSIVKNNKGIFMQTDNAIEGYGKVFITYSNIQQSNGSGSEWNNYLGIDGGGNIDKNPLFVDSDGDDNILGTEDDNFRLSRDLLVLTQAIMGILHLTF